MESIEELKRICQTTAKKDVSNVYMRYICRTISIYFTRLILPTGVTPNQVSFAMIMTGVFSCLLFLQGSKFMFFLGALSLQAWYILDCMDGEVARYRHYQRTGKAMIDKSESSLTGMYYDMINHYIVNFLVPVTIGAGLFFQYKASIFLFMGIFASLGQVLMLAMHDAKCRAILTHLKKYDTVKPQTDGVEKEVITQKTYLHWAFMIIHYIVTYPTVMNFVGIAALLNIFVPLGEWRVLLMIYLFLGSLTVSVALIAKKISTKEPDLELVNDFVFHDDGSLRSDAGDE